MKFIKNWLSYTHLLDNIKILQNLFQLNHVSMQYIFNRATIYASMWCRMQRAKIPKKTSESQFSRNIPMGWPKTRWYWKPPRKEDISENIPKRKGYKKTEESKRCSPVNPHKMEIMPAAGGQWQCNYSVVSVLLITSVR